MLHAYNGGEEGPQLLFRIDTSHAVATERPILSKLRDSRRRPEKRTGSGMCSNGAWLLVRGLVKRPGKARLNQLRVILG